MNKHVIVRISNFNDLIPIANNLRKDDIAELKAMGELTISKALLKCYIDSEECFTVTLNNKPIAMFGVGKTDMLGWGSIWLLGTSKLEEIPHTFVKRGRQYVKQFLKKYDILYNITSIQNPLYTRWLNLVGFKLSNTKLINGVTFQHFYITKQLIQNKWEL